MLAAAESPPASVIEKVIVATVSVFGAIQLLWVSPTEP